MTQIVHKIPSSEKEMAKAKEFYVKRLINEKQKEWEKTLGYVMVTIQPHFVQGEYVLLSDDVIYIKCCGLLMNNPYKYRDMLSFSANQKTVDLKGMQVGKLNGSLLTENEARIIFSDRYLFRDSYYISVSVGNFYGCLINKNGEIGCYSTYRKACYEGTGPDSHVVYLPVHRLHGTNSEPVDSVSKFIVDLLKTDMYPVVSWFDENDNLKKEFNKLKDLFSEVNGAIKHSGDNLLFDEQVIYEYLLENKSIKSLGLDISGLDDISEFPAEENYLGAYQENLLSCDFKRAKLDVYDENILLDPQRGHWDLWESVNSKEEPDGYVLLENGWTARNPLEDIDKDSIVAIDFGTKSTVVVRVSENAQKLPLQIGSGEYGKGVNKKNYENPTVVQFLDLETFINAYRSKEGRPNTSWNDITVSHQAYKNLKTSTSEFYKSFFTELKQWCGAKGKVCRIRDNKCIDRELPPFTEIGDGELNPVEIYAYYLGLYMNNMLQQKHIFLKYIMSFPATYEISIREKIRQSFENGIRKSLPCSLLDNEEVMHEFYVSAIATEPAAYAITALSEFGFEPVDDEEIYYSVFDFGGGTTDFDFGLYRSAPENQTRYWYELVHFGSNGDRTLGGENLLKLLAFHVFKDNSEILLHPNIGEDDGSRIQFTWPADKVEYPGYEGLINESSKEAQNNMHIVMEALRPLWENPDGEEARTLIENQFISVNLFKNNGKKQTGVELRLLPSNSAAHDLELQEIIEERIEKGIRSFFISMRDAFNKSSKNGTEEIPDISEVDVMNIFLAGNSTKSEYVKYLFENYIDENDGLVRNLLGFDTEQKMPKFKIYWPLGTEEAVVMQKELGIDAYIDDLTRPTCKTGVAFGLLDCRQGGYINVINVSSEPHSLPFQYYVGRIWKRKFKVIIERNSKLRKWNALIDASDSFDIYYTDSPIDSRNNTIDGLKRKNIHLTEDECDPNKTVYIRAIASRALEYIVVGDEEDIEKTTVEPKRIELE